MKILIYHGKHGDEFYDISTKSRKLGAYLHLFHELGSEGHYDCCEPTHKEEVLYAAACRDDAKAAMQFLQLRSAMGYEYERVEEAETHVQEAKDFDVWGEDPEHPLRDWQYEIGNDETRLGYWEWVQHKREVS